MEQAFGFGWEELEKAVRQQASHSWAKWGQVQSLEKMYFTQHQINGVEHKANLTSDCIFLRVCFKMGFLEAMVDTSIKTTLPGREGIQKQRKPCITNGTTVAYYCYYHIPENREDFPGYNTTKTLQESPEDISSPKSFLH